MLRPTPEEVLKSISYTFDELIRPDPAGPMAASYSLTVSNMLRQLLLTMQHEERVITEDSADLRSVLDVALSFLRKSNEDREAADRISKVMARQPGGAAPAQAARALWRDMRDVLEKSITHLQALRDRYGLQDDYRAVRQNIRDYLDRSLNRETVLIDGAFTLARR